MACAALPGCIAPAQIHCLADAAAPVCADVEVTFQLAHWHPYHGDFVHVCGDFNGWCDGFNAVGHGASTQWNP